MGVTQLNSSGPLTTSIGNTGQATMFPHAFTARTLHDPTIGAWNMDSGASSHLNNSITSLSTIFNSCITGDLYPVTAPSPVPHAFLVSQHMWHQRLGHPGSDVLCHLVSNNIILCNKEKPPVLCHACQLGKHVRLPFVSSNTIVNSCFDIIHSDVWTLPIPSLSGFKYYVLFLDHYSHFVWCDHGGEFDNRTLHKLFNDNGIQYRFSCPKTSQRNGKSERMVRTINNLIRTLLFQANLPPTFWVEALNMASGDHVGDVQRSTRDLVALVDETISEHHRNGLEQAGWKIRMIQRIRNPKAKDGKYNTWNYTKFQLWQLTDYVNIIFIDADVLILRNIDFLFQMPEIFVIANNGTLFNSGVMDALRPRAGNPEIKGLCLLSTLLSWQKQYSSAHHLPRCILDQISYSHAGAWSWDKTQDEANAYCLIDRIAEAWNPTKDGQHPS
ncbi:ribonuclease H-like domain-containing protein [Tanacetum coccineum]